MLKTALYDLGSYSLRLTNAVSSKMILKWFFLFFVFCFPKNMKLCGTDWEIFGALHEEPSGTQVQEIECPLTPYIMETVHDKFLGIIWITWKIHLHNNCSVCSKSRVNTRNSWDVTRSCKRFHGMKLNSWTQRLTVTSVQFNMRQESQTYVLKWMYKLCLYSGGPSRPARPSLLA